MAILANLKILTYHSMFLLKLFVLRVCEMILSSFISVLLLEAGTETASRKSGDIIINNVFHIIGSLNSQMSCHAGMTRL